MTEFPELKKAMGELDAARKSLADVFAEAGPDYDMTKVKSISGDKIKWIREQNAEITKRKERVEELKQLADIAGSVQGANFERGDSGEPERKEGDSPATLGELFVKSVAFKNYIQGSGQGPVAELKTTMSRSAGWPTESTRSGRLELTPLERTPLVLDYIPQSTISQAAYKYMEETTFGNPDGTSDAVEVAEAGTYPETVLELTERSQTVEKVAVWLPVTDEQLEDVAGAEAYINSRLTKMIEMRMGTQALAGNGTTPNLLGTENVSGIQTQALGTDTLLDATYKLFTTIRSSAYAEPSVVFIQPSKWQQVVLQKTADGQYIWAHPSGTGPQTIWGVPVVPTTSVTSTKLITGDYATYASLMIRRGLNVQVTNAHSDFFINGKQAIRADMRAVMVHFRPGAFGQVTGL